MYWVHGDDSKQNSYYSDHFLCCCQIKVVFINVAVCDVLDDMDTVHDLWEMPKASGILSLNMSDVQKTQLRQFHGITHILEKISKAVTFITKSEIQTLHRALSHTYRQ